MASLKVNGSKYRELIDLWLNEGLSCREISRKLNDQYGEYISHATISAYKNESRASSSEKTESIPEDSSSQAEKLRQIACSAFHAALASRDNHVKMKEFGNLAINAIKGLSSLRGDDDVRDDQRCRLHHEIRDLSNEELLERIRQKVVDLVVRVSFPGDYCQFSEIGDPLDESGVARPDDCREQFCQMVKDRLTPIFDGKIVANG